MADSSRPAAGLLFLHAQTAVHPGSGTALGAVDLPVQRERHTGYPTIPGTALKGVLRDVCREQAARDRHGGDRQAADRTDDRLTAAFGPAAGSNREGEAFAGAVSLTDARVLAFPVRSVRGVFAWVTCPYVLGRLTADLKLAGVEKPADLSYPGRVDAGKALFCNTGPLVVDGDKLVIEEFDFTWCGEEGVSGWVAANAVDADTGPRVKTHFAVLSDDDFAHFVKHATEVTARIALNYETKTVSGTALFYQEFVPAETLFYSVVLANPSRSRNAVRSAEELLTYVGGAVRQRQVIQVGGDETTGKGYCFARLTDGKGGDL